MCSDLRDWLRNGGDPRAGGHDAATVNEIYDALVLGGFDFQARNEDNAKRGLRISVSKNTAAFVRVGGAGDAAYGLKEWRPASRETKSKPADDETPSAGSNQSSDVPSIDRDDGTLTKGGEHGLAA